METKALFFSLYLGQNVFVPDWNHDDLIQPVGLYRVTEAEAGTSKYACGLLLRTVDQLTDEEALGCAQARSTFFDVVNYVDKGYEIRVIREINKISVAAIADNGKTCLVKIEVNNEWKLNIAQIDYLRSIGILLPFTYLTNNKPTTLTPAELVAKGWVKVKL